MKAPIAIAFLCILALAYLLWAQRMESMMIAEELSDLRVGLGELEKKMPVPRSRKPKETT